MYLDHWQANSGSSWAQWSKGQSLLETLFDMCGVAQHAEDAAGWTRLTPTPDDIAAL